MSDKLDQQIRSLIPLITNEWNLRYSEMIEHRNRLEQIGNAMIGLADSHSVEVAPEIRQQVDEVLAAKRNRMFPTSKPIRKMRKKKSMEKS